MFGKFIRDFSFFILLVVLVNIYVVSGNIYAFGGVFLTCAFMMLNKK